jgi:hypothetical protein
LGPTRNTTGLDLSGDARCDPVELAVQPVLEAGASVVEEDSPLTKTSAVRLQLRSSARRAEDIAE